MIAEAIRLAVPNAQSVAVDLVTIRWTDPVRELRYIYLTPRLAQHALIDFDSGVEPRPFDVKLAGAAQVVRAMWHRRGSAAKSTLLAEWEPKRQAIKTAVKAQRRARNLSYTEIAAEIGVPPASLTSYLNPHRAVAGKPTIAKLEAWTAKVTGKEPKPTPRKPSSKSQAHKVTGPARFRTEGGGGVPEVIGGNPPAVGNLARSRAFGLRAMVR
jgi:hypothetical protein